MAETPCVIDVRNLKPRDRQPLILRQLDGLQPGATLRLINDQDPLPLSYQVRVTRPNQFVWDYLECGPQNWIVDITRTGDAQSEQIWNEAK